MIYLKQLSNFVMSLSRCTEKILTQLEVHANLVGGKEEEEELLMEADRSWTFQVLSLFVKLSFPRYPENENLCP